MSNAKSLVEEVNELVEANGGWLDVISRLTSTFDHALVQVGRGVDCPFPDRHRNGGGRGDFRFSERKGFEGRAICSCMQDKGIGPVDLLLLDGLGGGNFVAAMKEIKKALLPIPGQQPYVRRTAPVVTRSTGALTKEDIAKRKAKLSSITQDLLPLNHSQALPARKYFASRGIDLSSAIADVKFHPALEYFETVKEDGTEVKKMVGKFPAIVSAFRDVKGRVVNLHKIYITEHGQKLEGVSKVKKIDSPINGFRGSSIAVANVEGCRTLHVTEGVEKGWAIHLATGESVKVAYSCSHLKSMVVDKAMFDRVIVWSDNDPVIPGRQRETGDGQHFAWMLYERLRSEGFAVGFMLPDIVHPEGNAKGPDWEDIIVKEGVLDLKRSRRMLALQGFAVRSGVFHGRASASAM